MTHYVRNIWCGRRQDIFFLVSKVVEAGGSSWYIVFMGKEYWIGPNRPGFLNEKRNW